MTSSSKKETSDLEELFSKADKYEEKSDFKNAFKCLLAAAQLGHVSSQINLGNFYASGKGVKKNLAKAAYWYKKAYKSGDNCGALNLAIDRRNQGNIRSAVLWFKKAIAMNCGEAHIELAKIYRTRKGRRNVAADLLRRALRMSRDNISDLAKEEAECLLADMAKR